MNQPPITSRDELLAAAARLDSAGKTCEAQAARQAALAIAAPPQRIQPTAEEQL